MTKSNATESISPENGPNIAPPLRTYQLAEQKYLDTRSSAWALLGVGCILLYLSLTQLLNITNGHRFLLRPPLSASQPGTENPVAERPQSGQ